MYDMAVVVRGQNLVSCYIFTLHLQCFCTHRQVFTKTRYIPGVSRHDLTSALRLASVWSQRTCRTWRVRARHALINCTCAWAPTNELRSDCGGNTLIAGCNPRNAKPRNLNLKHLRNLFALSCLRFPSSGSFDAWNQFLKLPLKELVNEYHKAAILLGFSK